MQKAIDILMNILFFILKITALVSDSGKRFAKKLLSSTVRLLLVLGIKVPLFAIGVLPFRNSHQLSTWEIFVQLIPRFTTQLTFRWSGCVGNIPLVMFTIFLNNLYQLLIFFFSQRLFWFTWHPTKLRILFWNCYRNIFT